MLYLTSVVAILSLSSSFHGICTTKAQSTQSPRFITLNGCKCNSLQCNCCAGVDLGNSPHREVCFNVRLIPNEVTLRATLTLNGNNIYSGQLDPSVAPICPPTLAGICFSINHVDIQKRQVCTKLSVVVFTLVKFPCIGQENGQLVIIPNTYT